jgi:superfamily I DNA/RNA helicase
MYQTSVLNHSVHPAQVKLRKGEEPRSSPSNISCRFDPSVHVLLQEELKHLYTAITRAKSNVSTSVSLELCYGLHA